MRVWNRLRRLRQASVSSGSAAVTTAVTISTATSPRASIAPISSPFATAASSSSSFSARASFPAPEPLSAAVFAASLAAASSPKSN